MHRARLLLPLLLATGCGSDWREFRSVEDGFQASFPGRPERAEKLVAGLPPFPVHTVLLARGAGGSLQVAVSKLPAPQGASLAALLVEHECLVTFAGASSFRKIGGRTIALGGQPGYAADGLAPPSPSLPDGGWEEDRCLLVGGQRMFHLIAVGPDTAAARADGLRFLDSFALLPAHHEGQ